MRSSTLEEEYLERSAGDRMTAAVCMTLDLMAGDAASFKTGYTLANAAWAAQDIFGIDRHEIEAQAKISVAKVMAEIRKTAEA